MRDLDADVVRSVLITVGVAFAGLVLVIASGATGILSPKATPSPTVQPTYDASAFYNVQGLVVDAETTKPIADVCVVIGPVGCQPNMPHTDAAGHFVVQLPRQVELAYDFHFVKPGYQQVDYHLVVNNDLNVPVRMQRAP